MFPTLSEMVTGERITVGPPFFNKWMVPIGLALLFLTGVGPLIAWRKATASHLRYQFAWPASAAAVTVAVCLAVGLSTSWAAVVCFGFCAFTFTTIFQEFARGVSIRKRNTGQDVLSALMGMILRGKRRYGGYIVHVGIVLMFIGFAGVAYQKESEVKLGPGMEAQLGRYTVRFDRLAHEEDRQKEMVTGEITAMAGGKVIDHLRPARWFFHNHESEPTTEVAIRRSPAEDLYITLGNYDLAEGTAMLKVVVNPVVDWIWFGFMLLALGTGIALVPDTVLERMTARAAAAASAGEPRATGMASIGLWLAVGAAAAVAGAPRIAHAQAAAAQAPAGDMAVSNEEAPRPVGVEENWLVHNIMCQCGTCRHNLMECESDGCAHAIQDRVEIHRLLSQGKTREQVIEYFISKYGGQVALAAPIDKGFNRLAWLLPYTAGVAGAGLLGFGAWRLSRRSGGTSAKADDRPLPVADPKTADQLSDKLDDELRNLD
jgi:cytochrome c-type biogenesis protein CcmF